VTKWTQELKKREFQFVSTPALVPCKSRCSPLSVEVQEQEYELSAAIIDQHMALFKQGWNQETLPVRFAECRPVYRAENSTCLWGLFQSYSYWADQLTLFCSEEQLLQEVISSLLFIQQMIRILDFEVQWILKVPEESKRPMNQKIADAFVEALHQCQISYLLEKIEKQSSKKALRIEGRFIDRLGREWKGPMIESFSPSGMPIVLSQTLWGSLDRVVALLVEKEEGILPLWLTQEQIRVICVGHQPTLYAEEVAQHLKQQGFRVRLVESDDKLGMRIHAAEQEKIPYILIIGEQEWKKKLIMVRSSRHKNRSRLISLDSFIKELKEVECGEVVSGSNLKLGEEELA
jgi:threonyl-tRNA synthetase